MLSKKRVLLTILNLFIIVNLIYPSYGVTLSENLDTSPTNRYGHEMVYDEINARSILFGGVVGSEGIYNVHSNETWSFNSTTKIWNLVSTITSPGLIAHHSMAYSSIHETIVCFGGLTETGNVLNETWIYDCETNNWEEVFPTLSPPPRSDASMYFDIVNDKFILFGGYRNSSDYYSNDLWVYDINANTWVNLNPLENPPESYGHRMIYDPIDDSGVLFGGHAVGGVHNDLWLYYYQNNSWIKTYQEEKPITRYWYTFIYDSTEQRMIIFGGRESESIYTDILNDTWSFIPSENTWMEIQTTQAPLSSSSCLVYDSANNLAILFGGVSSIIPFVYLNGTRIFDFQNEEWLTITSTQTINYYPEFTVLFFAILYFTKKVGKNNSVDKK
jgi:N-acetylneuraminic acid mutarotase